MDLGILQWSYLHLLGILAQLWCCIRRHKDWMYTMATGSRVTEITQVTSQQTKPITFTLQCQLIYLSKWSRPTWCRGSIVALSEILFSIHILGKRLFARLFRDFFIKNWIKTIKTNKQTMYVMSVYIHMFVWKSATKSTGIVHFAKLPFCQTNVRCNMLSSNITNNDEHRVRRQ